jgi:hypothetical protein
VKKIILTVLATAFVSVQAYAFSGTISFSGIMRQTTNKKGVTTNIFFNTPKGTYPGWTTNAPNTGDYAVVPAGVYTTMTNFSFTGNNTLTPSLIGPITPQWTFTFAGTTYSFDLEVLLSASSTSGTIAESGTGTAHIGGQTATAVWALDGTGSNFKFDATIHTTALPDGGSAVALLGIALAGIEGMRRVIRARKA